MLFIAMSVTVLGGARAQSPDSSGAAAEARLQALEARYRRAISLAPDIASYHVDLGETLQRRGRFDEAKAEYEEAVRLDGSSSRNRAMLGQFLLQLGDVPGAVAHLRVAVERDPLNPDYAAALAEAYRKQGDWREAAKALEHAVDLVPADSQFRRELRDAREKAGIPIDAPIRDAAAEAAASRPILLRVVELTFGAILAIAGVALVYPIVCGVILAVRTSVSLAVEGRA